MMQPDACLKALTAVRGDAVIVTRYSAAFNLDRIDPSPLNFTAVGAMGQGSSNALGLALGMPNHTIICLDGDGSLLMNLGTLVTIASVAPKNLYHFVVENGVYEVNGKHPIPGQGKISFAGFARAAGYAHVFEFDDIATFTSEIAGVLALAGPVFATLKVFPGEVQEMDYGALTAGDRRKQFKDAIKPFLSAPVAR
jgi:sulfopyruvate decarboxylase subunit beta